LYVDDMMIFCLIVYCFDNLWVALIIWLLLVLTYLLHFSKSVHAFSPASSLGCGSSYSSLLEGNLSSRSILSHWNHSYAYSDADWTECPDIRHMSQVGACFLALRWSHGKVRSNQGSLNPLLNLSIVRCLQLVKK
jgi:hypothetical protein